ncbi:MAG: hypothetical protein F7C36_01535 [Desulfurococcales archaeon]|nr:hypothetical protein [Desulfurococcales archaeon]
MKYTSPSLICKCDKNNGYCYPACEESGCYIFFPEDAILFLNIEDLLNKFGGSISSLSINLKKYSRCDCIVGFLSDEIVTIYSIELKGKIPINNDVKSNHKNILTSYARKLAMKHLVCISMIIKVLDMLGIHASVKIGCLTLFKNLTGYLGLLPQLETMIKNEIKSNLQKVKEDFELDRIIKCVNWRTGIISRCGERIH